MGTGTTCWTLVKVLRQFFRKMEAGRSFRAALSALDLIFYTFYPLPLLILVALLMNPTFLFFLSKVAIALWSACFSPRPSWILRTCSRSSRTCCSPESTRRRTRWASCSTSSQSIPKSSQSWGAKSEMVKVILSRWLVSSKRQTTI